MNIIVSVVVVVVIIYFKQIGKFANGMRRDASNLNENFINFNANILNNFPIKLATIALPYIAIAERNIWMASIHLKRTPFRYFVDVILVFSLFFIFVC